MGRLYSKAQILRLLKIKENTYYNAHKKGIFKCNADHLVPEEDFIALKKYFEQKGTGPGRPKRMPNTINNSTEIISELERTGVTKTRLAKELNVSRQTVSHNLTKGLSDESLKDYKLAIDRILKSGDLDGVYPDGYKVRTRGISRASRGNFYVRDRIIKYRKEGLSMSVIAQRIGKSKSEACRIWKDIQKAEPDVLNK